MTAPAAWIDALFGRLVTRYGVAFLRQYGDIDPAVVRGDWGSVLSGLSAAAIKAGLDNLPEKPPNAHVFRRICLECLPGSERQVFKALPAPRQPMPDSVRSRLQKLRDAA